MRFLVLAMILGVTREFMARGQMEAIQLPASHSVSFGVTVDAAFVGSAQAP